MKINPQLITPEIYNKIFNEHETILISKLRFIAHDLMIEMGRRNNVSVENRKCICGQVETEEHFLSHCNLYNDIRNNFSITNQNIDILLSSIHYVKYISAITYKRKLIRDRSTHQLA